MFGFKNAAGKNTTVSTASPLPVTVTSAPVASGNQPVIGSTASGQGADDNTSAVKVGGVYFAAFTPLGTGQRGPLRLSTEARALISFGVGFTASDGFSNAFMALNKVEDGNVGLPIQANYVFNGTAWDRQRGDTTGSYVVSKGGNGLATAQVTVGTSAVVATAARPGRQKVTLTSTAAFYVGGAGVTAATGFLVPAGAAVTLDTAAAVYAVAAAAGTVSVLELF